jgi:hypothetical protein
MFSSVDPTAWVMLIIALINAPTWIVSGFTLYYTWRTEKNTNSMKDALVKTTGIAAHAAGREEMRAEVAAKKAR